MVGSDRLFGIRTVSSTKRNHGSMTTSKTKLVTADDLLRLYGKGVRGELIRGVLHETMASGVEHGEIVMNLGRHLGNFVVPQRLGRLIGSDAGIWLERDPDTVREPDLAFISSARLPLEERVRGYSQVVPELIVEVVSPSDGLAKTLQKAQMWLNFGVRLAWVVDPDSRTIHALRPQSPTEEIGEDGELDGHDVLPGFSCAVTSIFRR